MVFLIASPALVTGLADGQLRGGGGGGRHPARPVARGVLRPGPGVTVPAEVGTARQLDKFAVAIEVRIVTAVAVLSPLAGSDRMRRTGRIEYEGIVGAHNRPIVTAEAQRLQALERTVRRLRSVGPEQVPARA